MTKCDFVSEGLQLVLYKPNNEHINAQETSAHLNFFLSIAYDFIKLLIK